MERYDIDDDGGRIVRFEGELLATADTHERDSIRWTETRIWRTKGGRYIVQKIGRTRVFHASEGCKYGVKTMRFELPVDAQPCPVCKPHTVPESSGGVVKMETNRYTVHDSATAQGLIECLYSVDEDDVTYMTRVNREALEAAALEDDAIRREFMVRTIE